MATSRKVSQEKESELGKEYASSEGVWRGVEICGYGIDEPADSGEEVTELTADQS